MERREEPPRDIQVGAGSGRVVRKEVLAPDLKERRADRESWRPTRAASARRVRANQQSSGTGSGEKQKEIAPDMVRRVLWARMIHRTDVSPPRCSRSSQWKVRHVAHSQAWDDLSPTARLRQGGNVRGHQQNRHVVGHGNSEQAVQQDRRGTYEVLGTRILQKAPVVVVDGVSGKPYRAPKVAVKPGCGRRRVSDGSQTSLRRREHNLWN